MNFVKKKNLNDKTQRLFKKRFFFRVKTSPRSHKKKISRRRHGQYPGALFNHSRIHIYITNTAHGIFSLFLPRRACVQSTSAGNVTCVSTPVVCSAQVERELTSPHPFGATVLRVFRFAHAGY